MSTQRTKRRQDLLEAVDDLARQVHGSDQVATYDEFHQRAANLILSKEARGAFAIDKEDVRLRDRYGRSTFGQSCLMARRLVEGGVRFVTIFYRGWDYHEIIFEKLDKKLPDFDAGLSTLLDDLRRARLDGRHAGRGIRRVRPLTQGQ